MPRNVQFTFAVYFFHQEVLNEVPLRRCSFSSVCWPEQQPVARSMQDPSRGACIMSDVKNEKIRCSCREMCLAVQEVVESEK